MPAPVHAHLSRRYRFSASHRLHVDGMSADRNREVFGKCNNPFGHGHNYTLQITLHGPIDAETGMVVNLADLDAYVRATVLERFDLANLNDAAEFRAFVPSTENLAVVLWRMMEPFAALHAPVRLHRIRVEETHNNSFDFYGGEHAPRAALPHTERQPARP
jgi:6-pyruvoyltetrahydropterin/6-carboxytetrahydropterin synthase